MRKIKGFVLNDSFTVLSAEAQKNVLGGVSGDTPCAEFTSSECGGPCVQTPDYAGTCTWVSGTGCRCVGYYAVWS